MPPESITGPKYGRREKNVWVPMVLFLIQDILEGSEAMESHSLEFRDQQILPSGLLVLNTVILSMIRANCEARWQIFLRLRESQLQAFHAGVQNFR